MVQVGDPAKSIIEYLTQENPRLIVPTRIKSQSRNEEWHTPEKVEKWKDFDFSVLRTILNGKLWTECQQSRSPTIAYPLELLEEERKCEDEKSAERILTSWTVRMVNKALDLVKQSLHPAIWVTGKSRRWEAPKITKAKTNVPQTNLEEPRPGTRRGRSQQDTQQTAHHYHLRRKSKETEKTQPSGTKRSRSSSTAERPVKRVRSLVPDGWGICSDDDLVNRLPSDVKGSWKSRRVTKRDGKYFDGEGYWRDGMSTEDQARPLRQIYTYCVEANARYGFLITCEEVLLVRVSPLSQASAGGDDLSPEELIQESMIEHGRLEYKSVRWGAHRGTHEKLDDFQQLTINLSLWTLFILAGNNWQIGWNYQPLEQECLARAEENSASRDGDDSVDSANSETTETSVGTETRRKSSVSSSEGTIKASVWHPIKSLGVSLLISLILVSAPPWPWDGRRR